MIQYQLASEFLGVSSTAAETHKVLSFPDGLTPECENQSISLSKAALKRTLTLNGLQGLHARSNYHFTDSSQGLDWKTFRSLQRAAERKKKTKKEHFS